MKFGAACIGAVAALLLLQVQGVLSRPDWRHSLPASLNNADEINFYKKLKATFDYKNINAEPLDEDGNNRPADAALTQAYQSFFSVMQQITPSSPLKKVVKKSRYLNQDAQDEYLEVLDP